MEYGTVGIICNVEGSNKRGGWKILTKLIIVEASNKRGGWKILTKIINVEGEKHH